MKNVPGSPLSQEDRILWNRVARTAKPLAGKRLDDEVEPPEEMLEPLLRSLDHARVATDTEAPARPKGDTTHRRQAHGLDLPTREKLAKGRLPLEARIDLHGMTQSEAHALLLSFLQRAHVLGIRHVLVITGKGSSFGSEGVLRKAVPAWFATPPFRSLVRGFESAARGHGGAGALYVRLRRGAGKDGR